MVLADTDFDWEDLTDAIVESSIVPVVGTELWVLDNDGQQQSVEQYYLQQLAKKLDLSETELPTSLNQFTANLLADVPLKKKERRKRRIVHNLMEVFEESPPAIPEPLLKLAEIRNFELFITTSFDTLLEEAIEQVRGVPCRTLANSLNAAIDDLADVTLQPGQPCVFHLFGAMPRKDYPGTEFAITDEDQLEYLQDLGEYNRKPINLFDYLIDKELMFLGCGLPDGVVRMMLRTLADCRLFPEKTFKFIESETKIERPLRLFLEGLTGELVLPQSPLIFVDEMLEGWREEMDQAPRAVQAKKSTDHLTQSAGLASADDDRGFVFVSYRREDKDAAQRLVKKLSARMPVWWDDEMEAGLWERQLENKIDECILFIPLLSKAGQAGGTIAKQEWNMAIERRRQFSDDEPFLLPVVIDDLEDGAERIPSKLWNEQCFRCQNGVIEDNVLAQIQQAYRTQIKYMGK